MRVSTHWASSEWIRVLKCVTSTYIRKFHGKWDNYRQCWRISRNKLDTSRITGVLCTRITGNNFGLSRFTVIKNRHLRFTKKPLSDPLHSRQSMGNFCSDSMCFIRHFTTRRFVVGLYFLMWRVVKCRIGRKISERNPSYWAVNTGFRRYFYHSILFTFYND